MKAKLVDISLFNYKNYENFAKFLEVYGNSKNLSKNYNKNFKNFQEEFKDKEINVKSVSGWIEILDNKKLIPMTKKPKKKIKKIKKQNCDEDIKVENEIVNKKDKENNNTKEAPQNQKELNQNNINNIDHDQTKIMEFLDKSFEQYNASQFKAYFGIGNSLVKRVNEDPNQVKEKEINIDKNKNN